MVSRGRLGSGGIGYVPGIALCAFLGLLSLGIQEVEAALFGRAWLEAIVIAILLGAGIRGVWTPGETWLPGIGVSGKFLLEVAIVLLGASLDLKAIMAAGPALMIGILMLIPLVVAASYALGKVFGLPSRMAMLVACGNAICGNSAIAAVAPVISAKPQDVAAAISFTAVLGIVAVLLLPLLGAGLEMDDYSYGVLAGLTVYAVPQVLAATFPVGAAAAQIGALVKLVRVLMLGPVVLALSLLSFGKRGGEASARPPFYRLVPWFIIGFLALAAARSLDLVPARAAEGASSLSALLTILAMAALGLAVDPRAVSRSGARVSIVVTLSLLLLGAASFVLIRLLPVQP